MEENHNTHKDIIRAELKDPRLVTETMMGGYISPTVLAGRVFSIIAQHPEGLSLEDLLVEVHEATPEVSEHPELEIDMLLLQSSIDAIKGLGFEIYIDEHGKIQYFATELDI